MREFQSNELPPKLRLNKEGPTEATQRTFVKYPQEFVGGDGKWVTGGMCLPQSRAYILKGKKLHEVARSSKMKGCGREVTALPPTRSGLCFMWTKCLNIWGEGERQKL